MLEHNESIPKVTSSRGAQWMGSGALVGLLAQSMFGNGCGNGNGLLGNLFGGGCNREAEKISALETALGYEKSKSYTDEIAKEAYLARKDLLKEMNQELVALRERATVSETKFECQKAALEERDKRRDLEIELAVLKATDPLKQAIQANANAINVEAERRCCADESIVNYANCTFIPKQVATVTASEPFVPQDTYDPIPHCGCRCRK